MKPIKDGDYVSFASRSSEGREVTGRVKCVEMHGTVVDLDVDGMSYTFHSTYKPGPEAPVRYWRLVGEVGEWFRTS